MVTMMRLSPPNLHYFKEEQTHENAQIGRYADGGYDLHGDIVEFYSATGENLPTRGWYCIEDDDIDSIFKKWID